MQTFYVVRYLGDQFSGKTLKEAIEAAMFEHPGNFLAWTVKAPDAGVARLMPRPVRVVASSITPEMLG